MELEPLNYSFDQAAQVLGISRTLLYQMNADGRLGIIPRKIGSRSLINRKELELWCDSGMPSRAQWQRKDKNVKKAV